MKFPKWAPSLVCAVVLFLVALSPIRLDDVFLYMTFGRLLVTNGEFGLIDPLIYTIKDHHWDLWHEWLSFLIFYFAQWCAGFEGLIVLRASVVMAMGLLVWKTAARVGLNYLTRIALLAAALYAASPRAFRDRSSAFTDLFVILMLFALAHPRFTAQASRLKWILPFLFLLWVQMHSIFLIGWFVLGLFILAHLYGWDNRSRRDWIAVLCACVAATALNPVFLDGMLWPLRALFHPDWGPLGEITEFRPLMAAEFLDLPYKVFAALFMAVSVLITALSLRARGFFPLFVVLTLSVLGLRYVRLMSMCGFGCALMIAYCLPVLNWRGPLTRARWSNALAALVLAVALVYLTVSPDRGLRFLLTGNPLHPTVPENAVRFLMTQPPGNIFNGWDLGGYLAWELNGRQKIAAHGFISEPELVERHIYRATVTREGWDEIILKGDTEYVFLRRQSFEESRQAAWIRELEGPAWEPIFVDGAAVIFRRKR